MKPNKCPECRASLSWDTPPVISTCPSVFCSAKVLYLGDRIVVSSKDSIYVLLEEDR